MKLSLTDKNSSNRPAVEKYIHLAHNAAVAVYVWIRNLKRVIVEVQKDVVHMFYHAFLHISSTCILHLSQRGVFWFQSTGAKQKTQRFTNYEPAQRLMYWQKEPPGLTV